MLQAVLRDFLPVNAGRLLLLVPRQTFVMNGFIDDAALFCHAACSDGCDTMCTRMTFPMFVCIAKFSGSLKSI